MAHEQWSKTQELENKLRDYLKVPQLSLFNNGTIALLVAIKVSELTGEVITTPFTFAATAHAISWMGLEPVFVDIDPVTMCIDPKRIEEAITPRTSAIMPVHVFGTPRDVKAIQEIAYRHNLKVIYDAAHAFGTEIDGTGIGNFGDITMYSFHATKLFNSAEGALLQERRTEEKDRSPQELRNQERRRSDRSRNKRKDERTSGSYGIGSSRNI